MFAEGVFTEKASLGKEPPVSLKKKRLVKCRERVRLY
jgi:hypothetical protein